LDDNEKELVKLIAKFPSLIEDSANIKFEGKKGEWYYIRIGEVFTSIPVEYVSKQMTDNIQITMKGDKVENLSYVTKKGGALKTTVSLIKPSECPKVRPDKRPPPEQEK